MGLGPYRKIAMVKFRGFFAFGFGPIGDGQGLRNFWERRVCTVANLEAFEGREGAVVLAVIGGFVAVGFIEEVLFAEDVVGEGGAVGGGSFDGLGGHFAVEVDLLDGPGAALAPEGDGHFLDADVFGAGLGVEVTGEVGEEFVEGGLGFAVDDDGGGEHAVFGLGFGGGLGAFLVAFWGGGAVGLGSVGAGCGDPGGGWRWFLVGSLVGHC